MVDLGRERRGGQRQTLLIARGLARRGHGVGLAARRGSPLAAGVAAAPEKLRLFRIGGRGEADPRTLLGLILATRRFRPDLLYANDAHGHGAAVWSGATRSRPLVVHRRVAFPPRGGWSSRVKYRATRRFLAVSHAVALSLAKAGVQTSRISIVPDGLPDEAFVERHPPTPPPLRLVHVGAFDGAKGQATVVRVVAELSRGGAEVLARFLGDGPERPRVERLARELGVAARCAFAGQVEDVPRELSQAHLFLLPSESEGASTALVEAMAAGCPAIVHDAGGAGEIVRDAGSGRALSTLEPETWARAVEEATAAPEELVRWIEAGRRFAESRRIERVVGLVEEKLRRTLG